MKKTFHIIVADDDEDDQELIKCAIEEVNSKDENILISSVSNGIELFDSLTKKNSLPSNEFYAVDLILLDINMPLMDGYTVLKKIKTNEKFKRIPIFVIPTLRIVDKLEIFFQLGAANVYSKPNSLKGYKDIIEEILASSIYLKSE